MRINVDKFFHDLDKYINEQFYLIDPDFNNEFEQTVFERLCGNKKDFRHSAGKEGIRHVAIHLISGSSLRGIITEENGVGFVPALKSEPSLLRVNMDPLEAGPYYGGYMRAVPLKRS